MGRVACVGEMRDSQTVRETCETCVRLVRDLCETGLAEADKGTDGEDDVLALGDGFLVDGLSLIHI